MEQASFFGYKNLPGFLKQQEENLRDQK